MSNTERNVQPAALADQHKSPHIDEHEQEAAELYQLAQSILLDCKQSRPFSTLESAIFLLRDALERQPRPHPFRSTTLYHLSLALLARFSHFGWPNDARNICSYLAEQATDKLTRPQNTVAITDHDEHSEMVDFASTLVIQFNQSVEQSSIDTAILMFHETLELQPIPNPNRVLTLIDLSEALVIRFHLSGQVDDLDQSVSLLHHAIALLPPPNPNRFRYLLAVGISYLLRFAVQNNPQDLLDADQQLSQTEEEDKEAGELGQGGVDLMRVFQQHATEPMIESALTQLQDSLKLRPVNHPNRDKSLVNLANAILTRYKWKGHLPDLEQAIAFHREALELRPSPHPVRCNSLNSLAATLIIQFEQTGDLAVLEEMIRLNREALELRPPPHPLRSSSLNNLANALSKQFQWSGYLPVLEEAISLHYEALALRSVSHPARSTTLSNLAHLLSTKFAEEGKIGDLEKAITLDREALHLRPFPHPDRSMSLGNMALHLHTRFEQKGYLPDLEEAILLNREAVKISPAAHPNRPRHLSNLSNQLGDRFEVKKDPIDINEAIALSREAVDLSPAPHPFRSNALHGLANLLRIRYTYKDNVSASDLTEAIMLYREALDLCPDSHPDRIMLLLGLANVLFWNYAIDVQESNIDIEEVVTLYSGLVDLLPPLHPTYGTTNFNHALSLLLLYQHTNKSEHIEDAMVAFHQAASCYTAPLLQRFQFSREWAHHTYNFKHPSVLEAIQCTINLLPQLSSLDMNQQQRQAVMVQTQGLASDVCAWAVDAGHLEKAVEFLSAARAIFWSQALQLRTPLDNLRNVAPQVAEKLQTISEYLEKSSRRHNLAISTAKFSISQDLNKEAIHCRSLNDERAQLLDNIRNLPGFSDFMLPKSFEHLQHASTNGPVVTVSANKDGCNILLLNEQTVKSIHCPYLTVKTVNALVEMLQTGLTGHGIRSVALHPEVKAVLDTLQTNNLRKGIQKSDSGLGPDDIFQVILSVLWYFIGSDIVLTLNLKMTDTPPRLWWCPIGPFAFLPLHAAGIYIGDKQECLSDFVISSYIPTLNMLLDSLPTESQAEDFKMLAVIESETPGQPSLPSALEELEAIQKHVPSIWLEEGKSFIEDVSSSLTGASFAHFACHGIQDINNPLDSALFLSGGLLTMAKITEHPLPKAKLAFLNACETARGDENVPDEAMHLSASLLFAGFRGVVGTMWPIYDEDGPLIADVFYRHLFRNGTDLYPDAKEAAYGLHLAVKKLRGEKKVSFRRWIPFIHLGV